MNELFLLAFVGAVGFAIWLLVFSRYGRGGIKPETSTDPTLPKLDDERPPLKWGSEVRSITDGQGTSRQTFDVVKVGLPAAFPGELLAVPKAWAPKPLPEESVVTLDGVLGAQWFVQAADEAKAKRLLTSPAFRAAIEPLFVKSRTVFVEKNHLYIAGKYEVTGDERQLWESSALAAANAIRAELRAMAKKK